MPKEIRFQNPAGLFPKKTIFNLIAAIFIMIIAITSLMLGKKWLFSSGKTMPPSDSLGQIINLEKTITQEENKALIEPGNKFTQAVITPFTPEPTNTQIPPTPTAQRPSLSLGVPIGGEIQFIIHRVMEGETLLHFAEKYGTTVDAIKAINYDLLDILWADWVIVIPLEFTDVSDLPVFEPYEVVDENIKISYLAEKLEVSLEQLAHYNNVSEDFVLYPGDWIVVPRDHPKLQ